jgi:hypothetical protein
MTEKTEIFERFKKEYDSRVAHMDANAIQDLVNRGIECRRLDGVVANKDEDPDVRLAAAMRGLDLAGVTARAAKPFECDPSELSLPELHVAIARIEAGFA